MIEIVSLGDESWDKLPFYAGHTIHPLICDASVLTALLLVSGPDGRWATEALADADLAAPSLVDIETANIIRRHELAGLIRADPAVQAHADLLDFAIEHWPYELLARRSWELRRNLPI